MPYFSGQGKAYVATAVGGAPGAFRFLNNVSALALQLETQVLEHKESTSGQRLTDLRLAQGNNAKFSITLEEFDKKNVALALRGADSQIMSGSVTNEIFPAALIAGDIVRLAKQKVSALVITDSAGAPATLTLGTHYEITSADHGTVKILNVAAFTQPFKAAYSHAAVDNINLLTQGISDRWIKFDGLNTADSGTPNRPVMIEIYRAVFDPVSQLDLISDTVMQLQLNGSALYDSTKANDAVLGAFGRIVLI